MARGVQYAPPPLVITDKHRSQVTFRAWLEPLQIMEFWPWDPPYEKAGAENLAEEPPWPDSARADAEPLPPPLARLLVHLLHQGSALRLAPAAFDETIAARLRAHAPLGPRAATTASLVYSACAGRIDA